MTPPQKKSGLARRLRHKLVNSRVTTRRARKQNPAETSGVVRTQAYWQLRGDLWIRHTPVNIHAFGTEIGVTWKSSGGSHFMNKFTPWDNTATPWIACVTTVWLEGVGPMVGASYRDHTIGKWGLCEQCDTCSEPECCTRLPSCPGDAS